jgi:hypothetical protein
LLGGSYGGLIGVSGVLRGVFCVRNGSG